MHTLDVTSIVAVRDQLLTLLTEIEVLRADISPLDCGARLDELGFLDSMGLVQCVAIVEEEFGVVIPLETLLVELTSIDAIARFIAEMRMGEVA